METGIIVDMRMKIGMCVIVLFRILLHNAQFNFIIIPNLILWNN